MDETIKKPRKKKVVLIIGIIFIIGIIIFFSITYFNYYKEKISNTKNEIVNGEIINYDDINGGMNQAIEDSGYDRKGSSNPALRFRNITTGNVDWYFDHDGKLWAYNITTSNISSGEGYFTYLRGITNIWATRADISTVNSTTVNASGNMYIGTSAVGTWLYNQTQSAYFYNQTQSAYFYNQTATAYFYNQTQSPYFYNQTQSPYFYNQSLYADNFLRNGTYPWFRYLNVSGEIVTGLINISGAASKLSFGNYYDTVAPSPSHIRLYESGANIYGLGVSTNQLNLFANQSTGNIAFYTGGLPTAKMIITDAGKVGIGTTTPTHTLNVVGSANISGDFFASVYGNNSFVVQGVTGGDGRDTIVFRTVDVAFPLRNIFSIQVGTNSHVLDVGSTGLITLNGAGLSGADFVINGQTVSNMFFADVSAGKVGIGTASPTQKLEISGGGINISTAGQNITMGGMVQYWDSANARGVIKVS